MFSKACEYGIKSVIYITEQSLEGRRVSIKQVTEAIDSPKAYTSKILQQLKKYEIINSDRGPGGGFSIERSKMDSVTLKQIVFSFDGDKIYKGCGLGLKECNASKPCPVHNNFELVRSELSHLLENTTLKGLATKLQNGTGFLRR